MTAITKCVASCPVSVLSTNAVIACTKWSGFPVSTSLLTMKILVFTILINQWVINKQLVQQSVNGSLIQFHNDLNNIEDILPPEFKKHKGWIANKRIKSFIEGNKHNTALLDKTSVTDSSLQDIHEDQESNKSLKRKLTCKRCHRIGHYAKTCTIEL